MRGAAAFAERAARFLALRPQSGLRFLLSALTPCVGAPLYEELQSRLEAMDEELVPFEELVNEFMDIVKPAARGRLSLT